MPRQTHWTPWQQAIAKIAIKVVGHKYDFGDYRKASKAVRLKWWRASDTAEIYARLDDAFPEHAFPMIQIEKGLTRFTAGDVIMRIFPLPGENPVAIPLFGIASLPKLQKLAEKSNRFSDYRKVIVKSAIEAGIISLDDARDPKIHTWKWVLGKIQMEADRDPAKAPQIIYKINEVIDTNSYEEIKLDEWSGAVGESFVGKRANDSEDS